MLLNTLAEIDAVMEQFCERLYSAGEPPTQGCVCRAAGLREHRLTCGQLLLLRAYDALQGWAMGAPETVRMPCLWVAALAGAAHPFQGDAQSRHAVRASPLPFDLFCGPSELLAVRVGDVLPPLGRGAYRQWALVIADEG